MHPGMYPPGKPNIAEFGFWYPGVCPRVCKRPTYLTLEAGKVNADALVRNSACVAPQKRAAKRNPFCPPTSFIPPRQREIDAVSADSGPYGWVTFLDVFMLALN